MTYNKEEFEFVDKVDEKLSLEQQKAIEEVKNLTNKESVLKWAETYATVMDWYCLDALIGLIPELWDIGTWAINFVVYMKLASDLDASVWDRLKIIGWQWIDILVWLVPIGWDAIDFFLKSNKKSAKIL